MRPPAIDALPENTGLSSGPRTSAARSAWPELRMSRKKPCRMPRFASPVACSAICWSARPTVPLTSSRVSSPTSRICSILHDLLVEQQADRPVVPQRVVEQPHVDAVDGAVDQQVLDVAQLADHADAAADHGGRERRQPRLERAHVRIERGVGEAERQLGVRLGRQRDAARSPTPTSRGDAASISTVMTVLRTPSRPVTSPMPSSLDEQVADAEPHVVARLVEPAAARGGEVDQARERRLRIRQRGHRLDRARAGRKR